jgi:hypothetical protein
MLSSTRNPSHTAVAPPRRGAVLRMTRAGAGWDSLGMAATTLTSTAGRL